MTKDDWKYLLSFGGVRPLSWQRLLRYGY